LQAMKQMGSFRHPDCPAQRRANLAGYTRKRDFVTFAGGQSDKIVACWDIIILLKLQKKQYQLFCENKYQ